MVKLIIFDLDGTLLNTLDDLADSCNYLLQKYHFPQHPLNSYRYFVGNGIRKLVERALPNNLSNTSVVDDFYTDFINFYALHKADKTRPYPGMIETLEALQNKGVKLAVASNKVNSAMPSLMEYYFPTIHFAALFGQRDGIPIKPNPQIIYDILKIADIGREDTLYVGDTAVDMATASNSGLKSVGVLWGFREREELENGGANLIIATPSELLTLV